MKLNFFKNTKKELIIYFAIISLTAFALGLSDSIFSNYFKDAYNVDAFWRGFIEFPRELPGFLCVFLVSILSFMGDVRLAILSQILSIVGLSALSVLTPPFAIMLVFLSINSLGMHLFMPVQDSIGLGLIDKNDNIGKRVGQFKSVAIAFSMLSSLLVVIGFKLNFFSFTTKIKVPFLIASILLLIVLMLTLLLHNRVKSPLKPREKIKLLFRKEYKYYYLLATVYGVQKQIMVVFGPWVLIQLLDKKADTISTLLLIGSFIGIFFTAAVGKWMDKYGVRKLLFVDALSFIGVYLVYGILSAGFYSGWLPLVGVPVLIVFGLFVIDRMSMQLGMVRVVYLRSIIVHQDELTPTISLGMSIDHIVSITCAFLGGIVWTVWGPQYIFFLAAAFSLVNLYVAFKVRVKDLKDV